jgi:hypothetical protein
LDGVEIGTAGLSGGSAFVEVFLSRASVAAIMAVNLSLELSYLRGASIRYSGVQCTYLKGKGTVEARNMQPRDLQ